MKKALVVVVVVAVVAVLVVPALLKGRGAQDSSPGDNGVEVSGTSGFVAALDKDVSVDIGQSPDGERLTVQYAVMAICDAASVPYQWEKSANLADPERRRFVTPVHVSNVAAKQAISDVLSPVGLKFDVDENGLYLHR